MLYFQWGGVTPNLLGFGYIVDAVELTINNPDVINEVTKKLYPTVAKQNGTTSSRVEHAIRHAVEQLYLNSDVKTLENTLGNIANPNKGTPTNSAFIATMALKMKRNIKPEKSI